MNNASIPNFIIAGTLKAATTSVFTYLCSHPQVCGSSIKETLFFLKDYTANTEKDIASYSRYFRHCRNKPDASVIMEASPGYLEAGAKAARRIKNLLPEVKLLFILRNPVDRIYSFYNFSQGHLVNGFDIGFDEYVERCIRYSSGVSEERPGMPGEYMRFLETGRYASYLKDYYEIFAPERIKVMFYEDMLRDMHGFMEELCGFLKIDDNFYKNYSFKKINVTMTARIKSFHKIALFVNRKLERFLRPRTALKSKIVYVYKLLNQKAEGYQIVPEGMKKLLEDYYSESNKELIGLLPGEKLPSWLR